MAVFYSKVTGNWEDGANWSLVSHVGIAGASPGTKGIDWPGSGDTAIISAGHTITVTTDLSGEATAILLQCDAPGTNNGTLTFKKDNNTGLKFTISTINASSTFNFNAGTRTNPIQAGNTCLLVTSGNMTINAGTVNYNVWGKHREHANSDVYCDVITAQANAGASTIVVNGDMSPALAANDWIWLVERNTSASTTAYAQLVQVASYVGGTKTATLVDKVQNTFTVANCLVFRAKDKLVNSILSADHTSGTDYVLEDDLYPAGTPGGSFLVTRANAVAKSGNIFPTSSSYNSGTKTLTAGSSSATAFHKGSILLMDDFNVRLTGVSTSLFGASGGTVSTAIVSYAKFDTWTAINCGCEGMVLYNSNLFDCKTINNSTLSDRGMFMYGVGSGFKSGSASANTSIITGAGTRKPNNFIRSYLTATNDSGTASRLMNTVFYSYFQDCIFYGGGGNVLLTPQSSFFKNCGIGNIDNSQIGIEDPRACQFNGCSFFGVRAASSYAIEIDQGANIFSNCTFGKTTNGRVNNNLNSLYIVGAPMLHILNGVTFDSGETNRIVYGLNARNQFGTSIRTSKLNGVSNAFTNFFINSGTVKDDTSVFKTNSPSIKFDHSAASPTIYFDVPIYLTAGSKTIQIYTNPSSPTWADAPTMFLMSEEQADTQGVYPSIFSYLSKSQQTTLTASTWSAFTLTYTIPSDGIYILRLFAIGKSVTVNWDDLTVS
jgi:hypothetical protein